MNYLLIEMRFVVDTNIIIAAFIRKSLSREILFNKKIKFYSPSYIISEIYKYKNEMMKKSNIDSYNFEILLSLILKRVEIVSHRDYKIFLKESKKIISDNKDAPFLACAISLDADGIWTEDKHFFEQDRIKVFTTKDMKNFLGI